MAKKVKMAVRVLNSSSSSSSSSLMIHNYHTINNLLFMPYSPKSILHRPPSLYDVICKVLNGVPAIGTLYNERQRFHCSQRLWIHSGETPVPDNNEVKQARTSENPTMVNGDAPVDKVKRKKLKGKRAVVRWLKMFRYKKKKEYERMTSEEKILYKLRKARKKEERYLEGLKNIEPSESSETAHDPEILTPEEHFYFLKMGLKSRNYVPIGRRGIYQGVILNMHLHWKKHQTLQVIVKTFTADEVKEIAAELARLSGGIVLDIHEENTIIMYRGKNYVQPPTEIMSPRITLSRKKALDKSKYRDGLRAVRRYIPRLEQDLDLLQEQAKTKPDYVKPESIDESQNINRSSIGSKKLREMMASKNNTSAEEDELLTDSDSEALSDIFETDSDTDTEERGETPLYLNAFEKFPVANDENSEDFETHWSQISAARKGELIGKDVKTPDLDEVDHMFLRATSLLKKKRR